ncbi:hypothetical protein [Paracidobacterium acidisoli]|uniref:Lysine-specific metallo-endopeptidase domain-containing protein n=1 Tax=Paracidobacterium acidisoli TaxID=2303751 RepID=A0A372INL5_9BACT|nr:hypothetical protein [Paracidobacterium acidisoli]MBT9331824.1 hypothetical protein [Paracidobacterium acidisoli]
MGGAVQNYFHTKTQHLKGASQRQRLQTGGGANVGWVVTRPGAQLAANDHAAAQWVLDETYQILPILIQRLNLWQNQNPVPPDVERLVHVYFKIADNLTNVELRAVLNQIGQRYMQIWAGIQADQELQIVDTSLRGTVSGYINPHFFEDANQPMKGRIHLNFQRMAVNDADTFRFFIHEASHKFARTADHNGGCYFIGTALFEAWEAHRAVIPAHPVPWGPSTAALTAQQAITHADSYGCFAENFRVLRAARPNAPWV